MRGSGSCRLVSSPILRSITHDGDPRDVFLKRDETYVADTRNCMTVYAMRGDCVMEIQVDD
jgi:hypothetical protein